MDTQLKRGMLEACVLSVLQKGDSYGYQIIKEVAACVPISESTLYLYGSIGGNGLQTV